jgi:hypothetical protein
MKTKYLFAISSILLIVAACGKEPEFSSVIEDDNRIPLNIDGSISQVATKATAAGFVNGDAVGLFAVNYSENNTIAGTLLPEGNQADNVKYVFDEPNYKWVPVKPVYYKDINTYVDLYLYYPYQGEISNVSAANFEVKKDQSTPATATALSGYEASDWLWGKATSITPSESKVQIPLSHKLSAVQVNLTEGSGFDNGEYMSLDKSVILTNTTRKATLDYATGSVTPVGNPQLDGIVMCPQTDGTFRAVVIPQTVDGGSQLFTITIDGIAYSFKQNNPVTYQQGKQLSVTITINKKNSTGEYELTLADAQIINWTEDLNTHGGEARQYYVVNLTEAGTLQARIEEDNKNPSKIRNLKVTGPVNEEDFFFMRDHMEILEAVNMKESEPMISVRIEAFTDSWDYESFYVASYGEPTELNPYGPENSQNRWDLVLPMIPERAFEGKSSITKFVFPEGITEIGHHAFSGTFLSGALILPESVFWIHEAAFENSLVSSITFPSSLKRIDGSAFSNCGSLSSELLFPEGLLIIGGGAFRSCRGLSGTHLNLPESLVELGASAFEDLGDLVGNLIIPAKIKQIGSQTFLYTHFTGNLILSNVQRLDTWCFMYSGFSGALIIPEGVTLIPNRAFMGCDFSSISFPSTLKKIDEWAFYGSSSIIEPLVFPEGMLSISSNAFDGCGSIPAILLPSSLQTIQNSAFSRCYNISKIVCEATETPSVGSNAFDGVSKDNFTVEVPAQSVKRYQAEPGWSDFKRIAAHYDFSLSRERMSVLNGLISRTFVLQAPANYSWSVQEVPDWVSVEPSSGTGKTSVTFTVQEMNSGVSSFSVNEGTFNNPSYQYYQGRSGDVVFKLEDKDYTCSFTIEQYDYQYPDGYVQTLQTASEGAGIDIVFTGDGYDARDIAKGSFISDAVEAYEYFFALEPYKTYKDYFNVYCVTAMSDESGIGDVNTIRDSKFGSSFSQNRLLPPDVDAVFNWARKADNGMDLSKSLVILLQNTSSYEGLTLMYTDGSALACCPVSRMAYPYDFRGIIQHEAGGHGFGKLGDEYIYHNAFIQTCICKDGCEHPQSDYDLTTSYGVMKSIGWFKNLSMTSDAAQVPWSHLIYHPQYSDYVDIYEGGYMHSRGMYRSEATSCMNNNIPYYSAISRQAIVERIKYCAGESFSLEEFYANDDDSFGPQTRSGVNTVIDRTFGVNPHFNMGSGHGPVLVGEHPNVK